LKESKNFLHAQCKDEGQGKGVDLPNYYRSFAPFAHNQLLLKAYIMIDQCRLLRLCSFHQGGQDFIVFPKNCSFELMI